MIGSLAAVLQERIGHALVWVATNTHQTPQKGHTFGEDCGPHLTHLPERQSMSAFNLRTCAAVNAPVLAISGALFAASPAQAVSANVVISEVYGGGNNGTIWKNDFVELYNRSDAAVDVTGWVVQYYSAAGTVPAGGTATLTGSVAPKHTYLVQMAAGANLLATPLPTPDAIGTAGMSGTSGRVDLRLADTTTVVDRVGYGTAATFEGSPAPGLSNTTSATRNAPCVDTDDNTTDFRATEPTPENSVVDKPGCAVPPPVDDPEMIAQIQGTSHTSPYDGKQVNGVLGVVTAVGPNGYWIQSTLSLIHISEPTRRTPISYAVFCLKK